MTTRAVVVVDDREAPGLRQRLQGLVAHHIEIRPDLSDVVYEKCLHCHLFVEDNPSFNGRPDIAEFAHSSRGDEWDEKIDGDHDATPSGLKATLLTWQIYGPEAMRVRFFRELDPR